MGGSRQYDDVRAASASTVEIDLHYAGQRCRERISLEPNPANLKRAAQHRAAILDAIARGVFDYALTFPNSKNAEFLARPLGSRRQPITERLRNPTPTSTSSGRRGR